MRVLAGAGQQVRALVRPGREPALPAGVEAAPGDLNQPDTLGPALSGARALFLLPGYDGMAATLMTNAYQWLPQLRAGDVVRAPFAGVRIASIDPADIAAVAAVALTSAGHAGHAYALSGPESLLPADRLRVLGEVLGRDLRFEAEPDGEARARMLTEMPERYVDAFFRFYVDGTLDESVVHPTVEQVTGRPPGTFREWAVAHADAFQ